MLHTPQICTASIQLEAYESQIATIISKSIGIAS